MKTMTLEEFLGSLYADDVAQARFRADPQREAKSAGLSASDCEALLKMDKAGFELACGSFRKKRVAKVESRKIGWITTWLMKLRRAL